MANFPHHHVLANTSHLVDSLLSLELIRHRTSRTCQVILHRRPEVQRDSKAIQCLLVVLQDSQSSHHTRLEEMITVRTKRNEMININTKQDAMINVHFKQDEMPNIHEKWEVVINIH